MGHCFPQRAVFEYTSVTEFRIKEFFSQAD